MRDELTEELVALCRSFCLFERDAICCGEVTVPQCVALQRLLSGPQDVSSLAEHLGVTVSASTRLIDGLERNGWIERGRDPDDRRRVLVSLSAEGRQEAEHLRGLTLEAVSAILEQLPEEEHATVLRTLGLVRQAVEACHGQLQGCCIC